MKTLEKVPQGHWKHLHKSMEWEALNKNTAKGMIGTFSADGPYLRWQSMDGQENMFMEVRDIQVTERKMWIKHRSGLQYWFEKVEESHGTSKKKSTTTSSSRRNASPSHGP